MSYYVELLRAKRALIIAAVILGIIFATVIIVRVSLHGGNIRNWPVEISSSATAHTVKTTLPDGSVKTVVDDSARNLHATFVQRGDNSFEFDIREPNADASSRTDNISMGSTSMNEQTYANGTMRHTYGTFKADNLRINLGWIFIVTLPIALIVATVVGGVLSKENDGHLEIVWTKPYSRERYALAAFGVDVAAIICAELMTIITLFACSLLFQVVPAFQTDGGSFWLIALAILGPVSWYALLTGASASMKRGPGLVLGLGWIVAVLVPSLSKALEPASHFSTVAAAFYGIFHSLAYIDPISYLSFSFGRHATDQNAMGMTTEATVGILLLLSIVYLALSVLQWRRVEA